MAWEGAIGSGGSLERPVTVEQYMWREGSISSHEVASVRDRQMRALAAGDVNGDGRIDLVAGAMRSGLWLFEQGEERVAEDADRWPLVRVRASGARGGSRRGWPAGDLRGVGGPAGAAPVPLGTAATSRRSFASLVKGDITWNITSGEF